MNPLIAKLLLNVGSSVIMELINEGAEVLKGRGDNTVYKDADKIKDIIGSNTTECKEVEKLGVKETAAKAAGSVAEDVLDDYVGEQVAEAVGDIVEDKVDDAIDGIIDFFKK